MTDKQDEKPIGAAARMHATLTPEQLAEMTPEQRKLAGLPPLPEPPPDLNAGRAQDLADEPEDGHRVAAFGRSRKRGG